MADNERKLRVFLCHASQDKPAVRELYKRLKGEGWIDPWLDEEKLTFGQHWTTVIEDALHDADIVIIFLSNNSVHKEGFVQRELNYAWELSLEKPRHVIFLIPFRLDGIEIPRYLASRQWGDYFGDRKENTYQILLRSLKQRHQQVVEQEFETERVHSKAKDRTPSIGEECKGSHADETAHEENQAWEKKEAENHIPLLEIDTKEGDQNKFGTDWILRSGAKWQLPGIKTVLSEVKTSAVDEKFIRVHARLIEETLASFGAPAQVVNIVSGPTITQFGVEPLFVETRNGRMRVRVSKIVALADDIALALAAPRICIQAPVPGQSYVGIEVPNKNLAIVGMLEIIESEIFQMDRTQLSFALGRDITNHPSVIDLRSMPHLLIAGTTGSGKSVCINSILTSFMLHNTPDDLRLLLIDPKRVELIGYNGVPHLLFPVVVETDRFIGALQWVTREMDKRYHEFARVGARNIVDYNARIIAQEQKKLPYLVVVIDELADLMIIAPDETEREITSLTHLARATGIHLIVATQRPSVDVVTGLIKANFPARIAFAVASSLDSRVILDQPGAERLLGCGDMLFQSPEDTPPTRLQGVFISDQDVLKLTEFWRSQVNRLSNDGVLNRLVRRVDDLFNDLKEDPLIKQAIDIVREAGKGSVSMLQRKLRIGYTRASSLMNILEEMGIVGPQEASSQIRKVLDL